MLNETELFLNIHRDVSEAVLICDTHINPSLLDSLISNSHLEKLNIVGEADDFDLIVSEKDKSRIIYNGVEVVFVEKKKAQELPHGSVFICYILNDTEFLLSLSYLKPRYLIGCVFGHNLSAFQVWEEYRKICEVIQIKTIRPALDPQILFWKRENQNLNIELSIIFPMYNVEKYLDQCIESVTKWKADYVEFIFVNDGSPDNSRNKIIEWQKKDSRIVLLDKENGGCASAREYGMVHAKGKYIGFVDPDDFTEPYMFCELFKAALTGSYDISYCGYKEYYEDTKECKRVLDNINWPYSVGCSNSREVQKLICNCRVAIWRGIYKKEMLEQSKIHFYTDLKRFDDLPFKIETFAFAKSVIAVPKYMYYYRLSRPGQDVAADDERLYVHFDIFKHLNTLICSLKDQRLIDYLQICKVDTHTYALDKIKRPYLKEYIKKAKEDLNTTGKTWRTYRMIRRERGRRKALQYIAISLNSGLLYKMLG